MPTSNITRLSQLFQPVMSTIPNIKGAKTSSKSYDNLTKYGLIRPVNNGMYALLPLGMRVLNKLTNIVDHEMEKAGAQKILLPAMTSVNLWKRTDRFQSNQIELFKIKDRHNKEYILSPTYEETICSLLSSVGTLSPKILPLKLYQISSKWRDEMKPYLGFLRSREFIMKDLYTFDTTLDNARRTYEAVCEVYDNIFQKLGVAYTKAVGDTGSIGGLMSHEYHYVSDIGQDNIFLCSSCQYSINKVVCKESHCPQCGNAFLEQHTAEVGHAFLLDTKYTQPLHATYKQNNNLSPLVMGCFGLGLSRIFTVAVEILSSKDELRWPTLLAPYTVCIVTPKAGSKEESAFQYVDPVVEIVNRLKVDAVLDDRTKLTIGQRMLQARLIGYPYVIVIGKSALESTPLFEIHDVNNSTRVDVPLASIHDYFANKSVKDKETHTSNRLQNAEECI